MTRPWLVCGTLVAIAGCTPAERGTITAPPAGTYRASTAGGRALLEGMIDLTAINDSAVVGTWQITWAPRADTTTAVGPQVGRGDLTGRRLGGQSDQFEFSLNPRAVDNNVYLLATRSDSAWYGNWVWSTIAGPVSSGRFSISRE